MISKSGKTCGYNYIFEQFGTIDEFIKTTEARGISEAYKDNGTAKEMRSEYIERSSWAGVASYSSAKEQFIQGTKAKAAMRQAYAATMISQRREMVLAPCGAAPIVANALRGLPNSMIDIRRKREPRTARVVIDMSIPWNIGAKEITQAGRSIIEAVGKLDAQGVQTEIICSNNVILAGEQINACGVVIKTAGQAFNAARVSFSMSSPAFLRVFQLIYTSGKPGALYDSGYGGPVAHRLPKADLPGYYESVFGKGLYISISEVVKRGAAAIDEAIKSWRATV